ncbi:MAG: AAA family ATPase [Lachnospiraceae bacterium]
MSKKLPVGIDGFEKIRKYDFYYVDKTKFIIDLLNNWGEVNLFTRPRRFGKSLNMSMLKSFFEIGCDKTLFDGLKIAKEKELCDKYMGKFPVISISLKSVEGLEYEIAKEQLQMIIGTEAERFIFLLESSRLNQNDKEKYKALINLENGSYKMSDIVLKTSLKTLSMLLSKHYGCKTILLIDEYDVPLDKAFGGGYYDEMILLIRNLFGNVLKTNDDLYFAVLTGCLRISKESIFTGLNNLKIHTITDTRYDEYFGFTDNDVKEMLKFYNLLDYANVMKEWYDGYQFGNVSVYCPWDVINYCDALLANPKSNPKNYWANTSGNVMVRRFINNANQQTKDEIERLITGERIIKTINQELIYSDLDKSIENLWSVLFTTGYLTQKKKEKNNEDIEQYELVIPNREIRLLFTQQIQEWFKETTRGNVKKIEQFCMAFPDGNAELIETMLDEYLWSSISIRDSAVRIEMKENFYHGMLLGLLQYEDNWIIKSNAESGEGYSDILIKTPERIGVVIETKYAQDKNLDRSCAKAIEQIEQNKYEASLVDDGMKKIVKYGIAFYKKNCKVIRG